jgi:hypothetical protein
MPTLDRITIYPVKSLDDVAVEAALAAAILGVARLAGLATASFPLLPGPDGKCGWLSSPSKCPLVAAVSDRRNGYAPGRVTVGRYSGTRRILITRFEDLSETMSCT